MFVFGLTKSLSGQYKGQIMNGEKKYLVFDIAQTRDFSSGLGLYLEEGIIIGPSDRGKECSYLPGELVSATVVSEKLSLNKALSSAFGLGVFFISFYFLGLLVAIFLSLLVHFVWSFYKNNKKTALELTFMDGKQLITGPIQSRTLVESLLKLAAVNLEKEKHTKIHD